jgi:hypothetical protein
MAQNKTTQNNSSVEEFIVSVENAQRQKDSRDMVGLMRKITGHEAKM